MESDLPERVADCFVSRFAVEGFSLRYEIDSLTSDFEVILEAHESDLQNGSIEIEGTRFDLETGAGCYFGETFRRLFSGHWYGQLEPSSGANYYTTRIKFGEYLFSPFCWLGYRLANGIEEGTVADCADAVTPSMRDGIDHKQRQIDEIIEAGGTVIDNQIF